MPFVTGDIEANANDDWPYRVVFRNGDMIISEWLVASKEDGEAQILVSLRALADDGADHGAAQSEMADAT